METKELINEAILIIGKRLKVLSVDFENRIDFEDNNEALSLTVFFRKKKGEKKSNFTVTVFSFEGKKYSLESLLSRLENEVVELTESKTNKVFINP